MPLLWLGLLANTRALFVPLADAVIGAAAGWIALLWGRDIAAIYLGNL